MAIKQENEIEELCAIDSTNAHMAIALIADHDIDQREIDIDAKEIGVNETCDVDKVIGTVEMLAEGGEGGRKKKTPARTSEGTYTQWIFGANTEQRAPSVLLCHHSRHYHDRTLFECFCIFSARQLSRLNFSNVRSSSRFISELSSSSRPSPTF